MRFVDDSKATNPHAAIAGLEAMTLKPGEKQSWLGCDLYTFRQGLIVLKDTYIKVVAA